VARTLNDSLQISIVIPMHNEASSIKSTIMDSIACLSHSVDVEIIVVDDGSTDGGGLIVSSIQTPNNVSLRLITRSTQGGLGSSLNTGLSHTTKPVLTWIPGDGEYKLSDVLPSLSEVRPNQIILTRRSSRGSMSRGLVSSLMHQMIKLLFRDDLKDFSGIFVVTKRDWEKIRPRSTSGFYNLDVAIISKSLNFQRRWISITWYPRTAGSSSVFTLKVIFKSLLELVLLRIRIRKYKTRLN